MILGSMQPYFFPYLGYFDLINYKDNWIIFDTAQYIYNGWINRNRVLHPQEGWIYVIVPLKKHTHDIAIKDVLIDNDQDWKSSILGKLTHYRRKAPFYKETYILVEECLSIAEESISCLNGRILEIVCRKLQIPFNFSYYSEMNLKLSAIAGPGDWALRICQVLGYSEYANPSGGAALYDAEKFNRDGIKLTIRNLPPLEYLCDGYNFIPNLSIIDLLMWNPPEKIKQHLDSHR